MSNYELIVGLEIHIQLNTKSKLFASDENKFGASANTNISSLTIALPGTLPKINEAAIEKAIQMGLATNCEIANYCFFDRKNYFYPDLPKGFQTTQDNEPICTNGFLDVEVKNNVSKIRINRIHMEEDAGKSIHDLDPENSFIDLNRAGTPLLELVTEPDIRTAQQAQQFVSKVRQIARYIEVSDGNMQEGSLRCDANISVRKIGETDLRNRVEVKNLNSLKFIRKAIEVEFERQVNLYEDGKTVVQQTRGYNAENNTTFAQRDKEMAFDYRYFPEPDLPAIYIAKEKIDELKNQLPALPDEVKQELKQVYGLTENDAEIIAEQKELTQYFKAICKNVKNYKAASNWLIGSIKSHLNDKEIDITDFNISPEKIAEIIQLVDNQSISNTAASTILFKELLEQPKSDIKSLINSLNLMLDSNEDSLIPIVDNVLNELSDKVTVYKN